MIAQVELKPSPAVRWTNFPGGSERRNGVFYRDLKPGQVEAAMKFARIALGEEGFWRFQEVRASDDAFAKDHNGRGPGGPGGAAQKKGGGPGGGGALFDAANYMIAFLGQPSKTSPGSWSWAATTSPSTSTTRGRPAPRPRTMSPRSRRSGETIRARRTTRSPRCGIPCTAC